MKYDVEAAAANLARRVARERTLRGWSFGEMARRLADAGEAVPPNAIGRIERGKRRVSFGEFIALARALNVEPAALLEDVDALETREALELVDGVVADIRDLVSGATRFVRRMARYRSLQLKNPDAYEFVRNRIRHAFGDGDKVYGRGVADAAAALASVEIIEDAINTLIDAGWKFGDPRVVEHLRQHPELVFGPAVDAVEGGGGWRAFISE